MTINSDEMSMGKRIAKARRAKNMDQRELGAAVSASKAAVVIWENDEVSITTKKLEDIAGVLGVAPEWLAYGIHKD